MSRGLHRLPWLSRVAAASFLAAATIVVLPGAGAAEAAGDENTGSAVSTAEPTADSAGTTASEPGAKDGEDGPGGDTLASAEETSSPDATNGEDGVDQPEDSSEPTAPDEATDLRIEASVSETVVEQGDSTELTILVENNGPGTDAAVSVDTGVPGGFVDSSTDDRYNAATDTWDVGELGAGESAQLVVVLTAEAGAKPSKVVASPTVSGEGTDGLPVDDGTSAVIEVQPAATGTGQGGGEDRPDGDATLPGSPSDPTATSDTGAGSGNGSEESDGSGSPGESTSSAGSAPSAGSGSSTGSASAGGSGSGDTHTSDTSPAGAGHPGGGDPTAGSPDASAGQNPRASLRTDVSSDRTGSEAALLMLGWMLLAAGGVLLVLGWLRRRRTPLWDYQR